MRRALVCLLVACGSRTDPGGAAAKAPPDTAVPAVCTDALATGAFTPVARYCSDGSNRAPTIAPQHPHVVWTRPIDTAGNLGLLVDASGDAFFGGVSSVGFTGATRWSVALAGTPSFGFLSPGGVVALFRYSGAPAFTLAPGDGSVLGKTPWPNDGAYVAVGADGTFFVELISGLLDRTWFAGVSRVTADGTTQWTESGDCDPGGSDFPAPHEFVRRGDHLVLVCNAASGGVEVLEVDADDAKVSDAFYDGSLFGRVALAPNGDLVFFTAPGQGKPVASLVTVARDGKGSSVGFPTLSQPWLRAIARDGTLVVTTKDGLGAVSGGAVRWQQPLVSDGLFVDSDHTIVATTGTSLVAFDVASGTKAWELALPKEQAYKLASAGPGKVYVLSSSSLTLVSD